MKILLLKVIAMQDVLRLKSGDLEIWRFRNLGVRFTLLALIGIHDAYYRSLLTGTLLSTLLIAGNVVQKA